ncbi:ATP-binding protein [Paenibacillus sp. FSL R10-2734]|uniref:ATP-binding protein n=1 Tax=Paenibacillus sp. FSL R10-2734 TaxID=2954691 RepID=UPI0030DA2F0E
MRFSINSRVLEHLGKDLINSDEIALTELVKNSYDAYAKQVYIHLIDNINEFNSKKKALVPINNEILSFVKASNIDNENIMVLEDDGSGMTYKELEEGFFTIGTDVKKRRKDKKDPSDSRLPLGEKGIGRLAAQRLSKVLIIETTSENSLETNLIKINWSDFIDQSEKLEEIEMESHTFNKYSLKYTRFWFIGLNFEFKTFVEDNREKQLSLFEEIEDPSLSLKLKDDLLSSFSFLMSPFDNLHEDFYIKVYLNNDQVNSDFKNEAINISETEHYFKLDFEEGQQFLEMSMTLNPWYIERIHKRLIDKDMFSEWRKSPVEYENLLKKYKEKYDRSLKIELIGTDLIRYFEDVKLENLMEILPIEGKVYSFKRDPALSALAIRSAKETKKIDRDYKVNNIKRFLDSHNGIKLYRGKFRIAKLGDTDNDWLKLQQARTKGQQFFRFELGNTIGYVDINDPYQDYIRETSSRLNLTDNIYSVSLLAFLEGVFNEKFYTFSQSAFYITREILSDEGCIPVRSLDKLKDKVNEADEKAKNSREQFIQFQALLDKVSSYISSETKIDKEEADNFINSISVSGAAFKQTIDSTLTQLEESKNLVKQVEHEKQLIALESYNNYKLMANGLVTEVLTHELHSILTNIKQKEINELHFKPIEDYLVDNKEYALTKTHLFPIRDQARFFNERVRELSHFYAFMEKTFLYNGTIDDFQEENLFEFFNVLERRMDYRLTDTKVKFIYEDINMQWIVPRGVLIHIFYNLMDNSLYWIKERRLKQKHNKIHFRNESDVIKIEKKSEDIIYYSDSGTGIIKRMENTLFQPLESGKDKNGRGMGLYIVRQLLRSFGGDIELLPDRNTAGNRYIFAIYLKVEEELSHGDE